MLLTDIRIPRWHLTTASAMLAQVVQGLQNQEIVILLGSIRMHRVSIMVHVAFRLTALKMLQILPQ
jgi:hypothetical protein